MISGFLEPRDSFSFDKLPSGPWGPLGDPPEPLQTCSKNVNKIDIFFRGAISLPWPSHESGPQPARRARKISMKSSKHRLTTCLPRDAMNQNVKKCCPELPIWGKVAPLAHPLHTPLTYTPCTHPLHTPAAVTL